jgi:hypothetical protein
MSMQVQEDWWAFVRESESHHGKWQTRNLAIMPVTFIMGALPGPNVFLYWNMYRFYCHMKSSKGTRALRREVGAAEGEGDVKVGEGGALGRLGITRA